MTKPQDTPLGDLIALADKATEHSIAVTEQEVALAIYTLARVIQFAHPQAAFIHLRDSDQGAWMDLYQVLDANGGVVDLEDFGEYDQDAAEVQATRLYRSHAEVWEPFSLLVPEAIQVEGSRRDYHRVLSIPSILDAPPALLPELSIFYVGADEIVTSLPFDSFESADSYADDQPEDVTIYRVTAIPLPNTMESM
jgi:hypothetical protein